MKEAGSDQTEDYMKLFAWTLDAYGHSRDAEYQV